MKPKRPPGQTAANRTRYPVDQLLSLIAGDACLDSKLPGFINILALDVPRIGVADIRLVGHGCFSSGLIGTGSNRVALEEAARNWRARDG